jgi:uncharacterized protein (TIGR03435 family)
VKRSDPSTRGSSLSGPTPSGFSAHNVPLDRVIQYAYGIPEYRIDGGPAWIRSDRFDILGKYPPGWMPVDVPLMVRALLAERFHLKARPETRPIQGYALRLARSDGRLGSRLRPSAVTDCQTYLAEARAAGRSVAAGANGTFTCNGVIMGDALHAGTRTIGNLAAMLTAVVRQPVTDHTGLTGMYDFDLEWSPELTATPGVAPVPGDRPSVFTAVQEQLGLKLDGEPSSADFLVVESVDPPMAD